MWKCVQTHYVYQIEREDIKRMHAYTYIKRVRDAYTDIFVHTHIYVFAYIV